MVEYRFVGQQAPGNPGAWALRNSGAMLHSPDPRTMPRDQTFPISIEAQLLGGNSDGKPRPTANMCSPGTEIVYQGKLYPDHCLNSSSPTFDGEQWVRAEFEVHGSGTITHYVNGQKVLEYEMPQYGGGAVDNYNTTTKLDGQLIDGGYISLQSESHPIDFRKVELLNLAGCMDKAPPTTRATTSSTCPRTASSPRARSPRCAVPASTRSCADSLPQEGVPKGRLEGPFEFHSKIIAGHGAALLDLRAGAVQPEEARQRAGVPGRPARDQSGGIAARAAGDGEPHRQGRDAGDHRHLHHAGQSQRDLSHRSRHEAIRIIARKYDALNDAYARFLIEEMLPEVGKKYNLTDDPEKRAIGGTSSGAICAFTVAWHRPDEFRRVISMIGSYTSIGYSPATDGKPMTPGGDLYPTLIRKNPIKPIRIFLQDGEHDLSNEHGNWFLANQQMLSAFEYANAKADKDGTLGARYEVRHDWGDGAHSDLHGGALLPDILKWIWTND